MARRPIHGVTDSQEVFGDELTKDIRSWSQKTVDWLSVPANMTVTMFVSGGCCFYYPTLGLYIVLASCILAVWGLSRNEGNPLKLPVQSGMADPNEMNPSDGTPLPAQGIFFLGNDKKTGKELWLSNSDCRQHFLVLGTTGSGKTETLVAFGANALSWGSGFLFCDGKGDVSLFAKIYIMARRLGREDDILVLNFMTGNDDTRDFGGKIKSNTLNPFATGSSDGLTQMVVSLMDDAGGEGGMWKGRATAMLTGVMRSLSWLRDQGVLDLNVSTIRDYMNLKNIMKLADPREFPEMPPDVRKTVKSYLTSLPGFQEEKKDKQAQTTLDQHGYLEMQFTKILGSLADVYGHIFATPMAEVDMHDVVLNRRILIIMPTWAKLLRRP
jgi:intracellular multiplication protein IcmO